MRYTHGGLERFDQSATTQGLRLVFSGGVLKDLLDVNIHLAEDRRRDRVTATLVGQNRHATLDTQRLEDGFRDSIRQTIERTDHDDSIVAFAVGLQPFAHCRNDFAIERGRDVLRSFRDQRRDIVGTGDQQSCFTEQFAIVFLGLVLHLIAQPLLQVFFPIGLKSPRASLDPRVAAGLQPPAFGRSGHAVIGCIEQEIAQIDRFENDAAFGIEVASAVHEKRAEAGEEIAGDHDAGTSQRIMRPRQRRHAINESGQLGSELVE